VTSHSYSELEMAKMKVGSKNNNLDQHLKKEQRCKELLQDRIQNEQNILSDKILAKENEIKWRSKVSTLTKNIAEKKSKLEELKTKSNSSYLSSFYGMYKGYFG